MDISAIDWNLAWLALAVCAALLELIFPMTFVWFTCGAVAAWLVAQVGAGLQVQLVVFIVVSVALLVFARPVALRRRAAPESREADVVGQHATVAVDIPADGQGRVRTDDGMDWAARTEDGTAVASGARVRIADRRSTVLIVTERL